MNFLEICGMVLSVFDMMCIIYVYKSTKQPIHTLRKRNVKFIHYIAPILLNGIASVLMTPWLILSVLTLLHGFLSELALYYILIPLSVVLMIDVCMYLWYYKRKTDITLREFIISCFAGAGMIWVYYTFGSFM